MARIRSRRTLAVAVTALAVAGGSGAAVAATQSSAVSKPNGAAVAQADQTAFLDNVAKRLGVTTQALKDALEGASIDRVDAALAAGTITQEQAAAIKARIASGELGPIGKPGFGGVHGGIGHRADLDAAATYLGLSVDVLRQRLDQGESLAQVASAQGKSVDGLKQALGAAAKAHLDEDVAAGDLTAAQAQTLLAALEARIDDLVNRTFDGPPSSGSVFVPSGAAA